MESFDDLNRVIMITWTKSTGHYAFDTLVYNIKYDPFGDAVEWTLGNGIVVSQSHDLRYFTDSITTDTFNIMGRVYTYDSVGNVRVTKDLFDSRNNATFTYDSLYQLTSAASSRYPDSVRLYDYEKNGDRHTLIVDTGVAQRTISYEYTDGKLVRIDDTLDTYLSYDASGNLTKWRTDNDSTTFEYNDAGQLVSVDGGGTAQYLYDGRGRRVKAVAGNSGRYIFYDQFGRIISEFRTSVIKWDRDFVYLNGRILAKLEKHYDGGISKMDGELQIDGLEPPPVLPLPTDIDIFYFHNDRLGTPLVVTNSNRDSVWAARYYPFGEMSYEWVSKSNKVRFPGQWHDGETGLYYNWHRYYDPKTGRYISADPIGLAGGINLYAYVSNNPAAFVDPWGLDDASPWQVGWEWLTGNGPRQREFYSGDPFLEELREHEHIRNLLHDIAECKAPLQGERNYDLSGLQGVPKYINDYSTLWTFGLTGNLAVTYLGSYRLRYRPVEIDYVGQTVTVGIHVWNASTASSAFHPPMVGYTQRWSDIIGRPLDNLFSKGPMSKTEQDFYWNETLEVDCKACKKNATDRR